MAPNRTKVPIKFDVHRYGKVTSTNDVVKQAIRDGAEEGYVAVAEEQTAGYGRRGHTWSSKPGGLYMSVLLRPPSDVKDLQTLGLVAAVAVRRTLTLFAGATAARAIKIKWPNDVIVLPDAADASIQHGFRKICGISSELLSGAVCLGIGINISARNGVKPYAGKSYAGDAYAGDAYAGKAYAGDAYAGKPEAYDAHADNATPGSARPVLCHGGTESHGPRSGNADSTPSGERNSPAYLHDLVCEDGAERELPTCDDVLSMLLPCLDDAYMMWLSESFSAFREEFDRGFALRGVNVRVYGKDGASCQEGVAEGVSDEGFLLLRSLEDGGLSEIADGTIIIGR